MTGKEQIIKKYNELQSKRLTRTEVRTFIRQAASKNVHEIVNKLSGLLRQYPNDKGFEFTKVTPIQYIEDFEALGIPQITTKEERELGTTEIEGLGKRISNDSIYQMITDKIIETIDKGTSAWNGKHNGDKGDKSGTFITGLPINFSNKKAYRGINAFMLGFYPKKTGVQEIDGKMIDIVDLIPITDGRFFWLTFKQIKEKGGKLIQGSKSAQAVYYNWIFLYKGKKISEQKYKQLSATFGCGGGSKSEQCKELTKIAFLKYYNVFNERDIENIDFDKARIKQNVKSEKINTNEKKILAAELLIKHMPNKPVLKIQHLSSSQSPHYSPSIDHVVMPQKEQYKDVAEWYGTAFHEFVHSTGNTKRLGRFLEKDYRGGRMGNNAYALEELVAEIGAAFLNAESGIMINNLKNNAAYIKSWSRAVRKELKADNKAIFKAAGQSQKAADYILNFNKDGDPAYWNEYEKLQKEIKVKGAEQKTEKDKVKIKGENKELKEAYLYFIDAAENEISDLERDGVTPYKLGDKYKSDFDYYGMLHYAINKVKTTTSLSILRKLHDSLEDVNYHHVDKHLWDMITIIEKTKLKGEKDFTNRTGQTCPKKDIKEFLAAKPLEELANDYAYILSADVDKVLWRIEDKKTKGDYIAELTEKVCKNPDYLTEIGFNWKNPTSEPADKWGDSKTYKDDLDYQSVVRSYSGTSHVPEQRAKYDIKSWGAHLADTYNHYMSKAKCSENKESIRLEFSRFYGRYLKSKIELIGKRKGLMSTMITGASNFPVSANKKRMDNYDNALRKHFDIEDNFKQKVNSILYGKTKIVSGSVGALQELEKKLDKLTRKQQLMKDTNKILRDKKMTVDEKKVLLMEQLNWKLKNIDALFEENYNGKNGFPSFSLTNNNAEIRRLKQRIEQEKRIEADKSDDSKQKHFDFEGGYYEYNYDANRLQVIYDEKPNNEERTRLKKNGFKWSPKFGAWQRQLTPNAKWVAKQLFKETEPVKVIVKENQFELGTPVVYKDIEKEYTGEVVMNPKSQRVSIGGKMMMYGKGAIKGIQTYKHDTFIVPDNWNDVKKFKESDQKIIPDERLEYPHENFTVEMNFKTGIISIRFKEAEPMEVRKYLTSGSFIEYDKLHWKRNIKNAFNQKERYDILTFNMTAIFKRVKKAAEQIEKDKKDEKIKAEKEAEQKAMTSIITKDTIDNLVTEFSFDKKNSFMMQLTKLIGELDFKREKHIAIYKTAIKMFLEQPKYTKLNIKQAIDVVESMGTLMVYPVAVNVPKPKKLNFRQALVMMQKEVASRDSLRPPMMHILHEGNHLIGTDAHALSIIKVDEVEKGKDVLYDETGIKQENIGVYPKYKAVIPKDGKRVKTFDLKELMQKLKGLVKAQGSVVLNGLHGVIVFDKMEFWFNPTVMIKSLTPLFKNGVTEVDLFLEQPNRAIIFKDKADREQIALCMPIMAGADDKILAPIYGELAPGKKGLKGAIKNSNKANQTALFWTSIKTRKIKKKSLKNKKNGLRSVDETTMQPEIIKQVETVSNSLVTKINHVDKSNGYFNIGGDIGAFLGNVEIKPVGSVACTLDAPQGAGKTRFFFQVMNELAKNYKVLFISLEEHPQSALFQDKVNQYIEPQNKANIDTIGELERGKEKAILNNLVPQYDVVLVDSWNKIFEASKLDFDTDLRKAYNGKLIFAIFQRTSKGSMRGGSKAQFDGDVIMKVEKSDDFKENYVFHDKNRYQSKNLDGLNYNIYYQKLTGEQSAENVVIPVTAEPEQVADVWADAIISI